MGAWLRLFPRAASRRHVRFVTCAVVGGLAAATFGLLPAHAGGGPENAVIVVDPTSQDAMQLANHYRSTRGIPEQNVLYMMPGNDGYEQFARFQIPALLGTIRSRGIEDHVDYVVVAPGETFFVNASGLVGPVTGDPDEVPPRRFSISSAYTLARLSDRILAGEYRASSPNQFFGRGDSPTHFDGEVAYSGGQASTEAGAERYLIGFLLGYTGQRGNTLADLTALVDRSAASDGTGPDGVFTFMQTDDQNRSNPRDPHFPSAVTAIQLRGGRASHIYKVDDVVQILPKGHHDVLGVMTGHAAPGIEAADMTLLPGAFGDHLTSFAATFDVGGQEKLSRWIAKGASGSMGTVEEPYVYGRGITGKFPHPRLLVWYFQGMSLGESLLRSHQWLPFQGLFYGDPLTRPFAAVPLVDVPEAPEGPVSGTVLLAAQAESPVAGQGIDALELLVDGVRADRQLSGEPLSVDTFLYPDGAHELRVVAYDESPVRNQGRWLGALEVQNVDRAVSLSAEPMRGGITTTFGVQIDAEGPVPAREVQLFHNQRVLAAAEGASARFDVPGAVLGAGIANLRAVALYDEGRAAVSAPVALGVHHDGAASPPPATSPPVAYSYLAHVPVGSPVLLDLPALGDGAVATTVTDAPRQSRLTQHGPAWLLEPGSGADGSDSLAFVASSAGMTSTLATVEIAYCRPPEIVRQPQGGSACVGADLTVAVEARGERLEYRWFKDGGAMPGASDASLSFAPFGETDRGRYQVQVLSWCGARRADAMNSDVALVTVGDAATCSPRLYLPALHRRG